MIDKEILSSLEATIGLSLQDATCSKILGGDISQSYKICPKRHQPIFLKVNDSSLYKMFGDEKNGLVQLEKACEKSTPNILAHGQTLRQSYIALEFIDSGSKTHLFWTQLGEKLAQIHQNRNTRFGYRSDNFIGSLIQKNSWRPSWIDFFIDCRLEPLISLAFNKGLLSKLHLAKFKNLYAEVNSIFPVEKPSLIHGDLWSGNILCDRFQNAFLIDPAIYYGHREMDLAFTFMFGGFDKEFYSSYQKNYPLEPNFDERKDYYNIYPSLVHINLFGKGYLSQLEQTLKNF